MMARARVFRTWILIGATLIVTLAGGAAVARRATMLFHRLDRAYAEWSLKNRVKQLANARMKGDMDTVGPFIINSCTPRSRVGNDIEFVSMAIENISLDEGVAVVALAATYRIPALGIKKPQPLILAQRWVRAGGTWYWDPGEPVSGGTLRLEDSPINGGDAHNWEGR